MSGTLQLGFDFIPPKSIDESMIRAASWMPADEQARIYLARQLLREHHEAWMKRDNDTAAKHAADIECIGVAMNDGTRFGAATEEGGYTRLARALAAADGKIPNVGQPGRFVLTVCGCRVLIVIRDVVGMGLGGFAAHAVDWGQPFISQTGYHSFVGARPVLGFSVREWVTRTIESSRLFSPTGGRLKEPAPLLKTERDAPPDYVTEKDAAWRKGGWLHKLWRDGQAKARATPKPKPTAKKLPTKKPAAKKKGRKP